MSSNHIAVNARLLRKDRLQGIGRFSHEILQRVVRSLPDRRFTFFVDHDLDSSFVYESNVQVVRLFPPARHPFLYNLWFQRAIPRYLKRNHHDIFLSTDGHIPFNLPIPTVNVMHDINFEHFPTMVSSLDGWYFRKNFPRFAHHSTKLFSVSEFSRFDIAHSYGLDEQKMGLIYNGVSDAFKPLAAEGQRIVRTKLTQSKDYFVYVGSLYKRKNVDMMLRAFDAFKTRTRSAVKFVLVAEKETLLPETQSTLRGMVHSSEVIFTGRLNDEALAETIASALAMIFVPHFEGFGLPVVEAFASGTAVVCSNVSALPEVADEAALFIDPNDEADLIKAMEQISQNESLRQSLILAGTKRAKDFSWDNSAAILVETLRHYLS